MSVAAPEVASNTQEEIARGNQRRKKDKKLPPATRLGNEDDEVILRELCAVNGINYDKLQQGIGAKVRKLEIFFFGCPHVPCGLDHFTNLTTLCIVNQRFSKISGLEGCSLLEELWICETQVQVIEGLANCQRLVRLHLYSNLITKIEGLEEVSLLEKLWLNGNAISCIEGLEALHQLKDLNLAGNGIAIVGNALNHLSKLEVLNLSGNKISSLNELVNLTALPELTSLSLCHPMDSPNPVCCLCNYSTHILYHFPHLLWLDGREVASQELQKLVHGLVLRKIQFYRMKIHHCRIMGNDKIRRRKEDLANHLSTSYGRLHSLSKHLKFLNLSQKVASDKISQQLSVITDYINKAQEVCLNICSNLRAEMEQKCQYLLMELHSGGNVKLTTCDPSHSSFRSCFELVHSRFSVAEVESIGISGLEITEVVRVENRLLFNSFNSKVRSLMDKEPYLSLSSSLIFKKMIDYLFLVWKPDNPSVCQLCQDGFPPLSAPSDICCLWMSNSVNIADHLRLARDKGLAQVEHGQLLLCKVFVGVAVQSTSSAFPTREIFNGVDSVYRTHGPSSPNSSTKIYSKDWFISHSDLVLPEYIINFKYLSPHLSRNPLDVQIFPSCDNNIAAMDSPPSSCPRLAMLDESTLLEITQQSSLASIEHIAIYDNRLTRFRLASSLLHLTSLVLSGNELSVIEDFNNLHNLEVLDISFNKMASLQGLRGLTKLKSLDVSWNLLTNLYEDLSPLRKHCPSLEVLDTRHNPWSNIRQAAAGSHDIQRDQVRCYIIGRLRNLQTVDGYAVSIEEASVATKAAISSHLTLAVLSSHMHSNTSPLPSFSVEPVAHRVGISNQDVSDLGNDWMAKVTTLCLCGLGIRKLTHLDQLPNLRWLSLARNILTSLEGLVQCSNLEELTLDENQIASLELLERLHSLTWLSVADNQLTVLSSTLKGLTKLCYLNLSNNSISTLQELKHLSALMELYLSANLISNLWELFCLKSLNSLVVLDLSLNPLTSLTTYRPFVIFQLGFLKALDGRTIGLNEVALAKDKLGGQLTQDFIFQKYPDIPFNELVKLDLPNCGLKHVDLSPVQSFANLASLNLENNSLTSFSGLVHLNSLKVLCLNHNRVEHLEPASSPISTATAHVLQNLQVLHLAYNGISNLMQLHLSQIPSLKALFLQGNEISKIEGIADLANLTELVLDRNKIKNLQENSLSGLYSLKELHLEENRLRDLSHFKPLPSLERLYLGLNRIQDYNELQKLECLQKLAELSIISNPVSRRLQHRALLIYQHPQLVLLDGVTVTTNEKHAAEVVFGAEQQDSEFAADLTSLPGLSAPAPLKVMNVPFGRGHQQQKRFPSDSKSLHGHTQNVQVFKKSV